MVDKLFLVDGLLWTVHGLFSAIPKVIMLNGLGNNLASAMVDGGLGVAAP